ncbi:MAG: class I SAM-dependent methyltransferase [Candidatus Hodarchaeota archaeon]
MFPKDMWLARKSIDKLDLSRLKYLTEILFKTLPENINLNTEMEYLTKMEKYWAIELLAAEIFSALGDVYKEYLPGRFLNYKRLVDILKEHYTTLLGKKIIEFGCGSGVSLPMLVKEGARCTGIDQSYFALEFLKHNSEKEGISNIDRIWGDFFKTKFQDNQFDISFNLGVFEHFKPEKQHELIQKMARVTKETLLIAIPNPDSPLFQVLRSYEDTLDPGNICPARSKMYPVKLKQLLKSVGFKIIKTSGILLAPSRDLPPETLTAETRNFFSNIPKMVPLREGKARIRDLIRFWDCVEQATSDEDLWRYAWCRYALGSKI